MFGLPESICNDFLASKVTQNMLASEASVTEMVGSLTELSKSREAIELMVRKMPVDQGIGFAAESVALSPYELTDEDTAVMDFVGEWLEDPEAVDVAELDAMLQDVSLGSPVSPLGQAVKQAAAGDVVAAQNFTSSSILLSAAPEASLAEAVSAMPVTTLAELETPSLELLEKIDLAVLEMPEIPEFPALPQVPEMPGLPDIPALTAEMPDVPSLPEIPEVPEDLLPQELLVEYQDSLKPFVELGLKLGESLPGWA